MSFGVMMEGLREFHDTLAVERGCHDPDTCAAALTMTGRWLLKQGYAFTTVTPATQARLLARRPQARARDLRDVFGWSLPFDPALLNVDVMRQLHLAGLVRTGTDQMLHAAVRFASLGDVLFAHSAYPTEQEDAVFFGPDTMRFARLIESELERAPLKPGARIADIGCGAGPGGIIALKAAIGHGSTDAQLVLADINPKALAFARANVEIAGLDMAAVRFAQGDLYEALNEASGDDATGQGKAFDLIVANPPYLNDASCRTYRHGGGTWGEELSVRILREGLPRLAPGGRLVLYTGACVINGATPLLQSLHPHLARQAWPWTWRELDPDVFGEELEQPAYACVERIAAVALVVRRPA